MASPIAITVDPEIQGGTPCFAGTRVPIHSLFSAIRHGRSVEYFLEQFPTVDREQVNQVLDHVLELLRTPGHAA
ncbi:MAG: DUF433 domain-containing protein [Phycisphaerae bacterium]|nr:DUF433 domain-containing protein [Phycisphaerae bacterium]